MLAQDYPRDRFEVFVVDGRSSDGTPDIVRETAERSDVPVRVLENPDRTTPAALNRALHDARGDYFVRVDAHSVPAPDYVRRAVEASIELDADLVGAWVQGAGVNAVGRAVARAFRSPFSMGNPASWNRPAEPRAVASAPCGAYRTAALRRIGGFDEGQLANQDYEANFRIRQTGGRVYIHPDVTFRYYARASFRGVARQFFRYGYYKARTIAKHPSSARPRHLAPPVALALWLVLLVVAWPVALGLVALYVVGVLVASVLSGRGLGADALLLPAVFATMHASWVTGTVLGLARWLPVRNRLR